MRRHELIDEEWEIFTPLLDRALVLTRLASLDLQHRRKLVGIGIELAWPVGDVKPGFNAVRPQVLAHGVP